MFKGSWLLLGLLLAQPALAQKVGQPHATSDGFGICPPGDTVLCTPLDASFQVPLMDASTGGNGQADPSDPCQRNDDDSTLGIPLQFNFDFYGQVYTSVFINNNGNITFDQPYDTFDPSGFPLAGFPMIAPFWGDVDTRADLNGAGVLYYRSEPHRFIVIWDHVGYYNSASDKQNTFELILSDGTDPGVGLGNNVCFCYDDMQWTTGDASGGVGGLGGIPATVGANKGDGVEFFQVGLFNQAGSAYDGPGGSTDGIDHLDNSTICFSTASGDNIAPIVTQSPPGDAVQLVAGGTVTFDVSFISPELGQTTDIVVDDGGLLGFTAIVTPGNVATASCALNSDPGQTGTFFVTFTATDDHPTNPLSTELVVTVTIDPPVTLIDNGCPGSAGVPMLAATGTFLGGSPVDVSLVGALPNAPAVLMIGLEDAALVRKGCTVLFLPVVFVPLGTDGAGEIHLSGFWPAGVPSGQTVFLQAYVVDAGAPVGFATSNTVEITAP